MKIVFTGGGTGGHFYPIIAVVEEINAIISERKLINVKLYYFSTEPYDEPTLFENNIKFEQVSSGKWRRYFSLLNFIDLFKIAWGVFNALIKLYFIYPDVVFSKGGYASVPVVFAARLLRIPIFIHESDSRPGRANLWAGRFAKRIAVSYPEAIDFFKPKQKTIIAVTGNPLRHSLRYPISQGAKQFLGLEEGIPVILIVGGSQGAETINEVVIDALPTFVERYGIIHQVGAANLAMVKQRASIVLGKNKFAYRYKPFDFLNSSALRMAAGAATIVVSRAGSMIFEIAIWRIPAIIIPIPEAISHDQRSNAFTYARSGAAVVIEQNNLLSSVLISEIDRLISQPLLLETMRAAAGQFARPQAARLIADELMKIALAHE